MDRQVRVCPRCGAVAEQHAFCPTCGLNLHEQSELPTQAEWEGGQPSPEREGTHPGSDTHGARRAKVGVLGISGNDGRRRGRALGILLAVMVSAAIGIYLVARHSGPSSGALGDTSSSTTTNTGATSDVSQRCLTLWNNSGNKSNQDLVSNVTHSAGSSPTASPLYATIGFSSDFPDKCQVAVGAPDQGVAFVFREGLPSSPADGYGLDSSGGRQETPADLPASAKAWNAHGNPDGTLDPGPP